MKIEQILLDSIKCTACLVNGVDLDGKDVGTGLPFHRLEKAGRSLTPHVAAQVSDVFVCLCQLIFMFVKRLMLFIWPVFKVTLFCFDFCVCVLFVTVLLCCVVLYAIVSLCVCVLGCVWLCVCNNIWCTRVLAAFRSFSFIIYLFYIPMLFTAPPNPS